MVVRIFQGLAVGGEWGGAALMGLEHAPQKKRGFGASAANMGGPAGGALAALVYAAFSSMPEDEFLAWGWRVPFLFSAVLVGVGLFVRLKVAESPVFEAAKKRAGDPRKAPPAILLVIRKYHRQLLRASTAVVGALVFQTFFATFAISMVSHAGTSSSAAVLCKGFGSLVNVAAIAYFAHLSDRLGRKRVLVGGSFACMLIAFPVVALLGSGDLMLVLTGYAIGNIAQAAIYGPVAAFMSELFDTRARYTGAGVSYQLAAIIGGFTPLIATSLWEFGRTTIAATGWLQYSPVGLFLIAGCLVTLASVSRSDETSKRKLDAA